MCTFVLDEYELPQPDINQLKLYFKNDYVPAPARIEAWKVLKFAQIVNKFDDELINESKELSNILELSNGKSLSQDMKEKILKLVKTLIPLIKPFKPLPHRNFWVLKHDGLLTDEAREVIKNTGAHSWGLTLVRPDRKIWVAGTMPFDDFFNKLPLPYQYKTLWDYTQKEPLPIYDE